MVVWLFLCMYQMHDYANFFKILRDDAYKLQREREASSSIIIIMAEEVDDNCFFLKTLWEK